MLTTLMPALQAMDLIGALEGAERAVISVPGRSMRKESHTRTGISRSMAGNRVAGCRTLAPK